MPLTKEQFVELRKKGLSVDQIVKFESGAKPSIDTSKEKSFTLVPEQLSNIGSSLYGTTPGILKPSLDLASSTIKSMAIPAGIGSASERIINKPMESLGALSAIDTGVGIGSLAKGAIGIGSKAVSGLKAIKQSAYKYTDEALTRAIQNPVNEIEGVLGSVKNKLNSYIKKEGDRVVPLNSYVGKLGELPKDLLPEKNTVSGLQDSIWKINQYIKMPKEELKSIGYDNINFLKLKSNIYSAMQDSMSPKTWSLYKKGLDKFGDLIGEGENVLNILTKRIDGKRVVDSSRVATMFRNPDKASDRMLLNSLDKFGKKAKLNKEELIKMYQGYIAKESIENMPVVGNILKARKTISDIGKL